ncbi:enzyme activator, partial [Mycena maculata]
MNDPTDSFAQLRIEPVPRAASSMSMRSAPPPPARNPRHAQTLPSESPYDSQSGYESAYDSQSAYEQPQYDQQAYDSPAVSYAPQQPWQRQQQQPPPPQFNPLYAAASNVLGMGPPPGQPGPPQYAHAPPPPPPPPPPVPYNQYAASQTSLTSSRSAPYPSSTHSGNSSYVPPSEASEFELRPPLNRAGTTFSVAPSSVKSKAVDLSAPPYTKEYIDQYRQRIKADPDPESHFLYAKYLIDAAKNIRGNAKDQRSAKKYSDLLIQEALKVIRRLATQGDAYDEAQFYLANCYGTGALGLQVDHERAYHLYLQAAKQNHAPGSYRVAVCNEIGAGTRRDASRAASFYRKAASLGDTPAMYKLGMILLHGSLGEQKNPREAINWLRRAAEQADEENPHALHELAMLHETGDHVPQDPIVSKNLFTRAAHLGYTQSQFKLGQCYEYGALACPMDPRRSIAWYTKAAEKGDSEAELALSGWYLTGSENVLKQSDSEAYLWARRAANKGLSKAEYAVGYYAEVGIGIKQDIEFAKRWYMRAAAQGNKRAMNRLTEMKRMGNKRTAAGARPTRQEASECII